MKSFRQKIYQIIFETDTWAGKIFDILLILTILLSIITVSLETVEALAIKYYDNFYFMEWLFTIIFSFELIARLYSAPSKRKYLLSFYGIIDIISILPMYLMFIFPVLKTFGIIRALRILRIFRILKLTRYTHASNTLADALKSSQAKITVFLVVTITIVCLIGSIMYLIEGKENGFTSIPKSMYWAIVTLTTVGYGDIVPQTIPGKILSSCLMIIGYGIIAVPTGLVSAEMVSTKLKQSKETNTCDYCQSLNPRPANFCSHCGHAMEQQS